MNSAKVGRILIQRAFRVQSVGLSRFGWWVEWGVGDETAYGFCIGALSQHGGLQPSVGGPTPQRADAAIRNIGWDYHH